MELLYQIQSFQDDLHVPVEESDDEWEYSSDHRK